MGTPAARTTVGLSAIGVPCRDGDAAPCFSELASPCPHWEAARFHHGISGLLVLLAGFILIVTAVRHYHGIALIPLGGTLAIVGIVGRPTVTRIRIPFPFSKS